MLDFIPRNNSVDVYINPFKKARDGSVITDADISFIVKTEAGTTVISATDMDHISAGHYRGAFNSSSLTLGSRYIVVVTCTNYPAQWEGSYRVAKRPLGRR